MYIICTVYTKKQIKKKIPQQNNYKQKKCTKTNTIYNNNKCGYVKLNTYYQQFFLFQHQVYEKCFTKLYTLKLYYPDKF